MTPFNAVTSLVSGPVTEAGYRLRGDTWYREAPLGLLAIDLQKSEWGDQYYLNLGVYVRDLGTQRWPKTYQCHLTIRAEVIDERQQKRWKELLDMELPLDPQRRADEVRALLVSQVLPLLDTLGTKAGLRQITVGGTLPHAAVRGTLQQYLGIA